MRALAALALTALLLNACGLKGPLYLPQEPAPPQPQKSQKSPDTEKK
jgi:predicted small lipoprotein YifL